MQFISVLWDCVHKGGIIRIYQECDGGIERSMPRITVWHHEACQVVIIGYPSGRFFSFPSSHKECIVFMLTIKFRTFISQRFPENPDYTETRHDIKTSLHNINDVT